MIYNNFQKLRLSALGLGAMRLPAAGENLPLKKWSLMQWNTASIIMIPPGAITTDNPKP